MKREGPFFRTIQADLEILALVDQGKKHCEVAFILGIRDHDVENAARRRRRYPAHYLVARGTTLRNVTA